MAVMVDVSMTCICTGVSLTAGVVATVKATCAYCQFCAEAVDGESGSICRRGTVNVNLLPNLNHM